MPDFEHKDLEEIKTQKFKKLILDISKRIVFEKVVVL